MKRKKFILLIIIIIIGLSLQIRSSLFYRLNLANFYKHNHKFTKSIELYNKILRKNSVKRRLSNEKLTKIHFDLGFLYAKLNFVNASIEAYGKGSRILTLNIDFDNFYRVGIFPT